MLKCFKYLKTSKPLPTEKRHVCSNYMIQKKMFLFIIVRVVLYVYSSSLWLIRMVTAGIRH